ncbi:hypothetical protein CAPTEDRAFT_204447 [Capitella teleta]|uniref:Uncharacterized protein n=1 Tax=Capitella teleta TaxID=283909 RepID=R7V785_CAPTE|nr:hypothetical protein CAPTEDRAFT_204447 [Capitella teleta]|eukprot:ELU14703.1 hypothetical protein CAPTEDRAFT_204447 [Capitella teleta]
MATSSVSPTNDVEGEAPEVEKGRRIGRCPFTRLMTLCRIPRIKPYADVSDVNSDLSLDETPLVEPVNWSYYQEEETTLIDQSDGELAAVGGVNPTNLQQSSPEWNQVRFGINNHLFLPSSHQYQSWQDMFGQHRGQPTQETDLRPPLPTAASAEIPPSLANLFRHISSQADPPVDATSQRSSNCSSLPASEVESSSSDEELSLMESAP